MILINIFLSGRIKFLENYGKCEKTETLKFLQQKEKEVM